MRNSYTRRLVAFFLLIALGGCAADNAAKQNLAAGYQALDQRQYDEAMARADQHLQKTPTGNGSADALYLKGRALEGKTAANPEEARQNVSKARDTYAEALKLQPGQPLESHIRAGLANASYWLDDYATAQQQWQAAFESTDDPAPKSFMLYRIGLCQQRLGQFPQADQTFAAVQQQFSGSDAAGRARQHQGYKAFTVQLATFANSGTADAAVANLRRQGTMASKAANAQGNAVVSVGPLPNYAQAQAIKTQFAATYPQAIIVP